MVTPYDATAVNVNVLVPVQPLFAPVASFGIVTFAKRLNAPVLVIISLHASVCVPSAVQLETPVPSQPVVRKLSAGLVPPISVAAVHELVTFTDAFKLPMFSTRMNCCAVVSPVQFASDAPSQRNASFVAQLYGKARGVHVPNAMVSLPEST
jgi:hypothetical protein